MLILRLLLLLGVLLKQVHAQSCPLCADRSKLRDSTKLIHESKTCQDFATAHGDDSGQRCFAAQAVFGTACGCLSNNDVSATACRLCGQALPHPERMQVLDNFDATRVSCAELEYFANQDDDNNNNGNQCTSLWQAQYANACCFELPPATSSSPPTPLPTLAPTSTEPKPIQCWLCQDKTSIPNPNQLVSSSGGGTCSDLQIRHGQDVGQACVAAQMTYGVYCGCEDARQSNDVCRICGKEQQLQFPALLGNANPSFPLSCSDLEYQFNAKQQGSINNDDDCQQFAEQYATTCCKTRPPSSSTPNPTTVEPVTAKPTTMVTPQPTTLVTTRTSEPTLAPTMGVSQLSGTFWPVSTSGGIKQRQSLVGVGVGATTIVVVVAMVLL